MFKTTAVILALCVAGMGIQEGAKKAGGKKAQQKRAQKRIGVKPEDVKATCPMTGAPAKMSKSTSFGAGKVYFCCDNCLKKFVGMKAKFNHQMFMTQQVKQTSCPMSGKPVKEGTEVAIAGAKVGFCCNNCKGAAEKMASDKEAAVVALFSGKKFTTGFKSVRQINREKRMKDGKGAGQRNKKKADK